MLEQTVARLAWRKPIQHFEIVTLLSVEQCLMRLTGRHPPFKRHERIAGSHPFDGEIRGQSITIAVGREHDPFELAGEFAQEGPHTRFLLTLCAVEGRTVARLWLPALLLMLLTWLVWGAVLVGVFQPGSAVRETLSALGLLSIPAAGILGYAAGWRGKSADDLRAGAPDVTDTVQVLANLVLATRVEGLTPSVPEVADTRPERQAGT